MWAILFSGYGIHCGRLLFFMYTRCMMRCPSLSSLVVGGRFFPAIHGYIKCCYVSISRYHDGVNILELNEIV